MRKIRWLLAALVVAMIGLVPVLAASSPASANPGVILKFDVMAPVTGPYVGTMNPIRMVPGGGLPWMISSGTGSLTRDGHLQITVRGLVLADEAPVPASLRGTNPVPDFVGIVSCQAISAAGKAVVVNVKTGQFAAGRGGERHHQGQGEAAAAVHRPHRVCGGTHSCLVRRDRQLARAAGPAVARSTTGRA